MLTATDIGPSGVKEIHYAVNGGSEQVAAGRTATVTVPLSGGAAGVRYWAIDMAGNVEANTQPGWLTPARGASMSVPVDESVYGDPTDSASSYRWDSASQQYVYNWKAGAAGYYWRIGVLLDDGQTYYATIGLR